MARFKKIKSRQKRYVFNFFNNKTDPNPAAVIFKRFPLPEEVFIPCPNRSMFDEVDFEEIGKQNQIEIDKFLTIMWAHFTNRLSQIDYEMFARNCFDHFENFEFDEKIIKTVDDFFSLDVVVWTLITHDCRNYTMNPDLYINTVGE